jgi:hypothetical protein
VRSCRTAVCRTGVGTRMSDKIATLPRPMASPHLTRVRRPDFIFLHVYKNQSTNVTKKMPSFPEDAWCLISVRFVMSDNWIPLKKGIPQVRPMRHCPLQTYPPMTWPISHFSRGRNQSSCSHTIKTPMDQLRFLIPEVTLPNIDFDGSLVDPQFYFFRDQTPVSDAKAKMEMRRAILPKFEDQNQGEYDPKALKNDSW